MDFDPFNDPEIYEYQPIPFQKRCKKLFRRMDLYALPITLRYKQEKKFYTNFGAMTSCVLICTIFSFTVKYILSIGTNEGLRQMSAWKLNSSKSDVLRDQRGQFTFGFQIQDENDNAFTDDTIIQAKIVTYTESWNNATKHFEKVPEYLQLDRCESVFNENADWSKMYDINWAFANPTGFNDY